MQKTKKNSILGNMNSIKSLFFSILALSLVSCGERTSGNDPSELSYVSFSKEMGGPVSCHGCSILDYESTVFYLTYQQVGDETCSGSAVYDAQKTIVLPTIDGERESYNVQKLSGPEDFNCFPQSTTFEITAKSNGTNPEIIEFFTGLEIYNMCLSSGCN